MKISIVAMALTVLASSTSQAQRQQGAADRSNSTADPSAHRLRFVSVDGVRVPWLDWGGTGTAMVFIPGFGNSAHVFDEFAPRFTDRYRVLGVTRVGYGESDQPKEKGYDIQSRVAHIAAALDSARITRAILVGHSLGGDEITAFAVAHPERTVALIYLDAAIDHSGLEKLEPQLRALITPPSAPRPEEFASAQALQERMKRVRGMWLPISEMVTIWNFDPNGTPPVDKAQPHVPEAIMKATVPPEFAKVRAPVLALYCDMTIENTLPWAENSPNRAKNDSTLRVLLAEIVERRAQFVAAVPSAKVFTYPAHHYQFQTMPDDTERRMRDFLATVNRPRSRSDRWGEPSGQARRHSARR